MSESETHTDRRERYEGVLSTIRHNTGGPDSPLPAGIKHGSLVGIRSNTGEHYERTESSLRAAVENGAVLRYRGRDGQPRYAAADREGLLAVIETEAGRDSPRSELIARCNQRLQKNNDG
jgi:hypothetical protein